MEGGRRREEWEIAENEMRGIIEIKIKGDKRDSAIIRFKCQNSKDT